MISSGYVSKTCHVCPSVPTTRWVRACVTQCAVRPGYRYLDDLERDAREDEADAAGDEDRVRLREQDRVQPERPQPQRRRVAPRRLRRRRRRPTHSEWD